MSPSCRFAVTLAALCVSAPVLADDDAVKEFEKAAKRGASKTELAEAAARCSDGLDDKGVKVLLKYGAAIESIDVYLACRDALASAQGAAFKELVDALDGEKRPEARVLAADSLGGNGSAAAAQALGKALQSEKEKSVRVAAIRGLKRLEQRDGIPPLFERLEAVGFTSADAEAEELYGALFALTGQAYENLEDWKKWWEAAGADFDPKQRSKSGDEKTTQVREGEGKIFNTVVRSQAFVLCLDISSSMRVIDLPPGETWKDKDGKSHEYKDPDPSGRGKPHPDSRFEKSREAFIKFLEGLSPRAKFTIIPFGEAKDTKPWKPQPVPANDANKKAAIDFVRKLRYGYATRTDLALEEAFKVEGVDSIYLYSDGIPEERKGGQTVEIPQDKILEQARTLNRTRKLKINCYGMASSKAMREFLRKLAEENDGEYQDIRVYAGK